MAYHRRISRASTYTLIILLLFFFPTSTLAACPQQPIFLPLSNCTISLPNQPTLHSWGTSISISSTSSPSSSLQSLCVVPSTVTNTSFLTTSLLCSPSLTQSQNLTYAQCLSRRGGVLPVSPSGEPVDLSTASTSGLAASDPGWITIMQPDAPFPYAVSATIHLHGRDSVPMIAGLIESGANHTTSHLSLGSRSVLLDALASSKQISSATFGFDAGSQSYASPRPGGLTLGGWDDGARAGTEVRFPMAEYRSSHQLNGRRTCPLQVTIASMALRPAGGDGSDDFNLGIEPAHPQQACLEMYDALPRLPSGVIARMKEGFASFTGYAQPPVRYTASDPNAAPPVPGQLSEIYIPEPGLIYPTTNLTRSFNASLVIMLAKNNFTVEIPLEELVNPVRGIARDGTRVVNGNFTELAVYQDPAPEDAAVLGRVFLSRAYLYVDYEAEEFTLTPSAGEEGGMILVGSGGDGDGNGSCGGGSGWSRVTIALVAVVAVLGVALLGALACWGVRRRRKGERMAWRPWRRGKTVEKESGPLVNGNGGLREDRGDYPEVDEHPRMTPVPATGTHQVPVAEVTPVSSSPAAPNHVAVQQRSPSEDIEDLRFRPRVGSVEVQGTTPLDRRLTPDELDGRGIPIGPDSPRTQELVNIRPMQSSSRTGSLPPERFRTGSASTVADDPLQATRTNRSMSSGWA
ncbi:hypothetical protein GE09DRAFT_1247859 [Coniochaeta sp. 2T2.1]|nr:hypothetical protein GE09DRAFT_1247859 [Coniochaeta sp. 2T2.1]